MTKPRGSTVGDKASATGLLGLVLPKTKAPLVLDRETWQEPQAIDLPQVGHQSVPTGDSRPHDLQRVIPGDGPPVFAADSSLTTTLSETPMTLLRGIMISPPSFFSTISVIMPSSVK